MCDMVYLRKRRFVILSFIFFEKVKTEKEDEGNRGPQIKHGE